METLVNSEGCFAAVFRGWLSPSEANKLYTDLVEQVPWISGTMQIYGKTVNIPRRMCFYGDDHVSAYKYSRLSFPVVPWREDIKAIRDRVVQETGYNFDSCLINYYRDGNDYIAWHSDKEVKEENNNTVVTVSLGCSRKFHLRRKRDKETVTAILDSGDAVIMLGNTQKLWEHTISKQACDKGRISLTLRQIV